MNQESNTTIVSEEAISAAVVAKAEKKAPRSAKQIFQDSVDKIKSTGTPEVDNIAKKLLEKIWSKDLAMNSRISVEGAQEFAGEISETEITVGKVAQGKSSRFVLAVGDLKITGGFASKAYAYSNGQHKTGVIGKTVEFDAELVAEVAEIFDIAV